MLTWTRLKSPKADAEEKKDDEDDAADEPQDGALLLAALGLFSGVVVGLLVGPLGVCRLIARPVLRLFLTSVLRLFAGRWGFFSFCHSLT